MRVIGNALFSGTPEDVEGFHIAVEFTADPQRAVELIRNRISVIIPEENWEATAATVLRGLGASESWVERCIWMVTHREELLSQRGGVIPGVHPA